MTVRPKPGPDQHRARPTLRQQLERAVQDRLAVGDREAAALARKFLADLPKSA